MLILKIFLQMYWRQLVCLFLLSFTVGFAAGLSCLGVNRERKKKGFRSGRLYGKDRKLDKEIKKRMKEDRISSDVLNDSMEYYANKKFR